MYSFSALFVDLKAVQDCGPASHGDIKDPLAGVWAAGTEAGRGGGRATMIGVEEDSGEGARRGRLAGGFGEGEREGEVGRLWFMMSPRGRRRSGKEMVLRCFDMTEGCWWMISWTIQYTLVLQG